MMSLEMQIFENLVELLKLIEECKKNKTEEEKKVLDDFLAPIVNVSKNITDKLENGDSHG